MLHIHRAERADALVGALRDLLAVPLDDPFAVEIVSVPTRGMERWLTQRLSGSLGASRRAGRRRVRQRGLPAAPAAARRRGGDGLRDRAGRRPVAARARGLAAAGAACDPRVAGRRAPERRAAVRRAAPRRRAVRPLRPAAPGDRPRVGDRGRRLAGRAVAAAAGAARRAEPGRAARAGVRAAAGGARARRTCRGGSRSSGSPASPPATWRCCARWRRRATSTSSCCIPRPALWERVRGHAVSRRADDETATLPRNRLLASWGRDARELQLVLGGDGADHHHADRGAAATRCSPASSTTCATTWPPRRCRAPTGASRSTPATAGRARSRSCATRSCTRSPRTRRSSRATSS